MRRDDPAARAVVDEQAARWVARRDAGLTASEERELRHWRDADPARAAALERYERAWSELARPRTAGQEAALRAELARQRRTRWAKVGVPVCLLLLTGGGAAWLQRSPEVRGQRWAELWPAARTTILTSDRRELPDGSLVESRPGAVVEVDYSSQLRRVTLRKGEAHFRVAPDAARPFVVAAGGVEVKAVGTEFSVQLTGSLVEVLVTEGRVAVATAGRETQGLSGALVDAGNRLALNPAVATRPRIEPVSSRLVEERLAWRSPRVEFTAVPLSEVVEVLNRYQPVPFELGDPSLAEVRLSGLFRADDAEVITGLLRTGFDITAEPRAGRLVLRRVH
jgi:transmembrane sensor